MKLLSCIRSKHLLQKFHQYGICASHGRVVQLLSGWASAALNVYTETGQVIPINLRKSVFIVFTKDNIDKNSSSNTATEHFNGTSVCAFQCLKSIDDVTKRDVDAEFDISRISSRDYSLPTYANVNNILVPFQLLTVLTKFLMIPYKK